MDKVLLITGSSSGIGAATAKIAANSGYSICINYKNNQQKAEELKEGLSQSGSRVIAVKADVSSESEVLRLFDTIDSKLGVISHLVNNAGIISPIKTFEETTLVKLNEVFSINVFGSLHTNISSGRLELLICHS